MQLINFELDLQIPILKERWDILFTRAKMIGKNTCTEFNVYRNNNLFIASLTWSRKTDHAGVTFNIGVATFQLELSVYDTRHWDNDNEAYDD